MNVNNFYNERLAVIAGISDSDIEEPGSIPMNVYLQEAENLYNWCQDDKEKLIANGLDWAIVDDMPARILMLRETQSMWMTSDSRSNDARKMWVEKVPSARALQKDILRSLRFACRENQNTLQQIKRLGPGRKNSDMIQNLSDLAAQGRKCSDELKTINFDLSKLDKASKLANELAGYLAQFTNRKSAWSKNRKIRNQAYTHLKESVDSARLFGKFVFRMDDPRFSGYASSYSRSKNSRYKKNSKPALD
jgi:hypothetical protein